MLGVDGVPDFNAPHSRRHDEEVQLYAFDCLALDGEDLRQLPLSMRKRNLPRLLARRPEGIFVAPFEQGEIGPDLFWAACGMGLKGLGIEARRSALSRWSVAGLGQGEESEASGYPAERRFGNPASVRTFRFFRATNRDGAHHEYSSAE